ncbi:hypothetical protein [Oculatella sp. FACHB-28]|uniref:hypothetical protein n=1 Tax=Oculatella sp. FACHB-28 TaxID=2692845 RepID=UPI0016876937|nr:hypothetical protein [Oculatella sp. FACHB-28]
MHIEVDRVALRKLFRLGIKILPLGAKSALPTGNLCGKLHQDLLLKGDRTC